MEVEMELPGAASLAAFCAADESELTFTDELKNILEVIALTGNYWHEWNLLKCLLSFRLKQVLTQYFDTHIASGGQQTLVSGEAFNDFLSRLLECLDSFNDGPPFTLQRFCELLLNPGQTYPNVDKVSLAFEKLLLVTSTLPVCKDHYPSKGEQGWNQAQENCMPGNVTVENGSSENRHVVDEDMLDVVTKEDKQSASDKLPNEEASLSLEKRTEDSEKNCGFLPGIGKPHALGDSPLLDGDLVDISLDDQNTTRGA
ncbi:hypothetical protein GOP47_0013437 [Adiantum capillus-veneris]|uniref:Serine/threonine-protein phosphatase 4 regulatory subunit 2 n=1 Tax=Adiantum capillus-veneris TaxID=13818 RepID=A0A9D4ZFS1_ADICA|nr:hypothetical protein GOP47_0013437 [Adiantum capillus-veneris]